MTYEYSNDQLATILNSLEMALLACNQADTDNSNVSHKHCDQRLTYGAVHDAIANFLAIEYGAAHAERIMDLFINGDIGVPGTLLFVVQNYCADVIENEFYPLRNPAAQAQELLGCFDLLDDAINEAFALDYSGVTGKYRRAVVEHLEAMRCDDVEVVFYDRTTGEHIDSKTWAKDRASYEADHYAASLEVGGRRVLFEIGAKY